MYVLCSPQAHLCTPEYLLRVHFFPSKPLKQMFEKYASEPHQTTKYRIGDFLGLRTCASCASSKSIKLCSDFRNRKNVLFTAYIVTITRSLFPTLLHTCGFLNVPVADGFCSECCSPSRYLMATACTHCENQNELCLLSHRIAHKQQFAH